MKLNLSTFSFDERAAVARFPDIICEAGLTRPCTSTRIHKTSFEGIDIFDIVGPYHGIARVAQCMTRFLQRPLHRHEWSSETPDCLKNEVRVQCKIEADLASERNRVRFAERDRELALAAKGASTGH